VTREAVRCLRVDAEVDVVAGRGEPGGHGEVVLQQDVSAADGQQDRGKATEITESPNTKTDS